MYSIPLRTCFATVMAHLQQLPAELLHKIASSVEDINDLTALFCTCRQLSVFHHEFFELHCNRLLNRLKGLLCGTPCLSRLREYLLFEAKSLGQLRIFLGQPVRIDTLIPEPHQTLAVNHQGRLLRKISTVSHFPIGLHKRFLLTMNNQLVWKSKRGPSSFNDHIIHYAAGCSDNCVPFYGRYTRLVYIQHRTVVGWSVKDKYVDLPWVVDLRRAPPPPIGIYPDTAYWLLYGCERTFIALTAQDVHTSTVDVVNCTHYGVVNLASRELLSRDHELWLSSYKKRLRSELDYLQTAMSSCMTKDRRASAELKLKKLREFSQAIET